MSRVKNIEDDYGFFGIGILNNTEKALALGKYEYPDRVAYLLGNEISGLSVIKLPGEYSLNVAVTGSIVMYDRINKNNS